MTTAGRWTFREIFPSLPEDIRSRLESTYAEIQRRFAEGKFEPTELNGAKFCEVLFRLVEWHTTGKYTPLGTQIKNFEQASRQFEPLKAFPDSVRFNIPRTMAAIYTLRNKRGVGHVGGDVDPNYMDSVFVVSACQWILAELVRLLHGVHPQQASQIVERVVALRVPLIWEVSGKRRVLDPSLSFKEKTLLLLYSVYPESVAEADLISWTEHSNASVYRRDVLKRCHSAKLVEYDPQGRTVVLSPLGVKYAEENISSKVER